MVNFMKQLLSMFFIFLDLRGTAYLFWLFFLASFDNPVLATG
jgi:hypothetical protein